MIQSQEASESDLILSVQPLHIFPCVIEMQGNSMTGKLLMNSTSVTEIIPSVNWEKHNLFQFTAES